MYGKDGECEEVRRDLMKSSMLLMLVDMFIIISNSKTSKRETRRERESGR